MKKTALIILAISLCIHGFSSAPAKPGKYKAIIRSFSIGTVEGFIYVNLFEENKDKIKIDVTQVLERTGFSSVGSGTVEVSTISITEFSIDSSTYKFWSIHNGSRLLSHYCVKIVDAKAFKFYASANDSAVYTLRDLYTSSYETIENCMTKKIYGTDTFGIYQVGLNWNPDIAALILPTKISLGRSFIYNPVFLTNSYWSGLVFKACPGIKKNMDEGKEGWVLKAGMTNAEKTEVWKKYIDEWATCHDSKEE